MPRNLIKSLSCGPHCTGEQSWTTEHVPTDLGSLAITHIAVVVSSHYIQALEVKYSDGHISRSHGLSTATREYNIVLGSDEWIVKIEISGHSNALNYLKFVSNTGITYGPYGGTKTSTSYVIEAPSEGLGVLWLNGCSLTYLSMLQATFADYGTVRKKPDSLTFLKLETGSCSAFRRQLLSPVVTLMVGTPAESQTVHEDILCQLPFFKAALLGEFLEAHSKIIKMPEDDPACIAALIEYLSTGQYTYASGDAKDGPNGDLEQTLFHLRLHAIAVKYDCDKLAEATMQAVCVVLGNLSSIDALAVWQEGYKVGVSIAQLEPAGLKKVKPRIKELFTNHAQAISHMIENTPALAKDVMEMMAMEK